MSPPRLRVDDREHAVEDRVAGEEHALLVEQEAEVVRRVAGRVQHLEPELGAVDRVAVAEHAVEVDVTSSAFGRLPNASTSAPVAFDQPRRRRRSDRDACA